MDGAVHPKVEKLLHDRPTSSRFLPKSLFRKPVEVLLLTLSCLLVRHSLGRQFLYPLRGLVISTSGSRRGQ